jgi:uncharacterized oligopeptide transporter (OPT) family protein
VLKKFGGSTILENNIVQTIGSAGESIAGGVVFTIPALLFLMPDGRPHAETLDYFAWSEVLACIGAVRTYRRIYRSSLDPMPSRLRQPCTSMIFMSILLIRDSAMK